MAGVYWRGTDGNLYVKADGFHNGQVSQFNPQEGNTAQADFINGLKEISDPNTGGHVEGVSTVASAGGAGSAATAAEAAKRAANEAGRSNTQKAIDSLDTELSVGNKNIDDEAASITSKYDKEAAANEADYGEQTVTNNQSLLRNKQNALVAGAQGARGLRATLSSLGALGGDGIKLANRAVTNAANQDIGEATETAGTNAVTLDKSISRARDEDKDRRDELATQQRNQKTALEGKVESKRQSYFQKMADLFGEVGDAGNATSWLNRAGDLNAPIAAKTAVAATPFSTRAAAFTPGTLADYLAGAGDMTVSTADGGNGSAPNTPTSILAGRKDKERKQAQAVAA